MSFSALSNIDDFNSARAAGCQDLAGMHTLETPLFRQKPAVFRKTADSGGPSLPSGSIFPGILEIRVSGHIPESDGNGPETG